MMQQAKKQLLRLIQSTDILPHFSNVSIFSEAQVRKKPLIIHSLQ
jgi:hypothetical protein